MKTYFKTQVLPTPYDTANRLAMDFIRFTENMLQYRDSLYIALSGGNTPQLMFEILANEYPKALVWNRLHFFWVDERCVLSEDPESNYGNAFRLLFSKVAIPKNNIHPIHGGDDPLSEVVRYTGEILAHVPCSKNMPVFDLILLGMGNDGHTASIFPGQADLFETMAICSISQHPQTLQKRITLTGKVINNASEIVFLVTGSNKADQIKSILFDEEEASIFPAKKIKPLNGALSWYLDNESATHIEIK
ncbi:MAG TPA: 6-phosphogluconolactonase [Bacteroidales bacterium]